MKVVKFQKCQQHQNVHLDCHILRLHQEYFLFVDDVDARLAQSSERDCYSEPSDI
jgi:hypothetical protein